MLRLPLLNQSPVGNPPDPAIFNIHQMEALLGKILGYVRSSGLIVLVKAFNLIKELSVEGDCLLRGTRIVIPVKHRQKVSGGVTPRPLWNSKNESFS